jgi:hypothetical protein
MPRYGFLLMALIGLKANFPEVCQGILQLLTPCSIAFTIESVTLRYTSSFGKVFSFVDIKVDPNFGV